ncbi:MAG: hypothetical protein H0W64_09950 [Gammaproteobacteria bacterium]|nr:hypothetical protein [Gammaproteobacteria bacterium]
MKSILRTDVGPLNNLLLELSKQDVIDFINKFDAFFTPTDIKEGLIQSLEIKFDILDADVRNTAFDEDITAQEWMRDYTYYEHVTKWFYSKVYDLLQQLVKDGLLEFDKTKKQYCIAQAPLNLNTNKAPKDMNNRTNATTQFKCKGPSSVPVDRISIAEAQKIAALPFTSEDALRLIVDQPLDSLVFRKQLYLDALNKKNALPPVIKSPIHDYTKYESLKVAGNHIIILIEQAITKLKVEKVIKSTKNKGVYLRTALIYDWDLKDRRRKKQKTCDNNIDNNNNNNNNNIDMPNLFQGNQANTEFSNFTSDPKNLNRFFPVNPTPSNCMSIKELTETSTPMEFPGNWTIGRNPKSGTH